MGRIPRTEFHQGIGTGRSRGCPVHILSTGLLFAMVTTVILPLTASQSCFADLKSLGTHNSYHLAPPKEIINILGNILVKSMLPPEAFLPEAWEYEHKPISKQLDAGVRFLELDVFPDAQGGAYAAPAGLKLAGVPAYLDDPAYQEPGWKVLHIVDVDFRTNCVTLKQCLEEIKSWSDSNLGHQPIVVFIEVKNEDLSNILGSRLDDINSLLEASSVPGPSSVTTVPPLTLDLLTDLESEIRDVFDDTSLITQKSIRQSLGVPAGVNVVDVLRGSTTSPESTCTWPALESLKGKVMFGFILTQQDIQLYEQLRTSTDPTIAESPAWLVWDNFNPDGSFPDAIFSTIGNENLSEEGGVLPPSIPSNVDNLLQDIVSKIDSAAQSGLITRARADVDTIEARNNYTDRLQALLRSSANGVATDFLEPSTFFSSNYSIGRLVDESGDGSLVFKQPSLDNGADVSVPDSQPISYQPPTTNSPLPDSPGDILPVPGDDPGTNDPTTPVPGTNGAAPSVMKHLLFTNIISALCLALIVTHYACN